jgi:hypothetical protein
LEISPGKMKGLQVDDFLKEKMLKIVEGNPNLVIYAHNESSEPKIITIEAK